MIYRHKNGNGYIELVIDGIRIAEHRYMMELMLGRKLKKNEVVHHIDGNKSYNHPHNIKLMTITEHSKHHSKVPEMITLNCMQCGKSFKRRKKLFELQKRKGQTIFLCSKRCTGLKNKIHLPKTGYGQKNEESHKIVKQGMEEGLTGYGIAKKYGISKATAYYIIKQYK